MSTQTPAPKSRAPERKIVAGGFAGAVTAVLVWSLSEFAAVKVPGEIAAALTTIITAVVAYLVPNK